MKKILLGLIVISLVANASQVGLVEGVCSGQVKVDTKLARDCF